MLLREEYITGSYLRVALALASNHIKGQQHKEPLICDRYDSLRVPSSNVVVFWALLGLISVKHRGTIEDLDIHVKDGLKHKIKILTSGTFHLKLLWKQ